MIRQQFNVGQRVIITSEEVCRTFKRVNTRKAAGPDRIIGRVLRECREELSVIYSHLFQVSVDTCSVPTAWKLSFVVPVPKISKPVVLNDYRLVALTSIVMKSFEKIVLERVLSDVRDKLDPLQFAYRRGRSTEDALLYMLHRLYSHLDKPKRYARVMFIDFSSAFNTIRPHILMERLFKLGVNSRLIRWVETFLTSRVQCVRVNSVLSSPIVTNTGAPQGSTISPVLYTLYTNECRGFSSDVFNIKYADDTAIVGLITEDEVDYRRGVDEFVDWCQSSFLQLNIRKTKEIIFDFRIKRDTPTNNCQR